MRENLLLGACTRCARHNARRTLQRMFALFPRLEERQRQGTPQEVVSNPRVITAYLGTAAGEGAVP